MAEGCTYVQGEMEGSKEEEWSSKGNGQRCPYTTTYLLACHHLDPTHCL
jgi:hypothetical protein